MDILVDYMVHRGSIFTALVWLALHCLVVHPAPDFEATPTAGQAPKANRRDIPLQHINRAFGSTLTIRPPIAEAIGGDITTPRVL